MLLASATEDGWADAALADPRALLSDHAHCEKKAALTALSLLNAHPGETGLVLRLARLAEQEAGHLRQVLEGMGRLGYSLLPDRGNPYAQALLRNCRPGDLLDRLLAAAMIEARSHERLELLADAVAVRPVLAGLAPMLAELAACEAGHTQVYLALARMVCGEAATSARLDDWLRFEAAAISSVRPRPAVH